MKSAQVMRMRANHRRILMLRVQFRMSSLLILSLIIIGAIRKDQAQNCNKVFNIMESNVVLKMNRSITRQCLQCLPLSEPIQEWIIPGYLPVSNSYGQPGFEFVNSRVLVLLNPMNLFGDGKRNSYEVECRRSGLSRLLNYHSIRIFSIVIVPPILNRNSLTVTEGDTVGRGANAIRCFSDNLAEFIVSIRWEDSNGKYLFRYFLIRNINIHQAGEYRCVEVSTKGEVVYSSVTIIVLHAPKITSENSTLVHLTLRSNAILSCNFTGEPAPSVVWDFNGAGLVNGLNGVEVVITSSRSELRFRNTRMQQEGVYIITARNRLGTRSLRFNVLFVPDAVTGLAIASASESAISLSWRYQSDGSRPRTGVEIEVMTGGTLVRSVTKGPTQTIGNITSLQPLTNYTFIAYVVSEVGRSPPIALQTFTPSLSLPQPNIVTFAPMSSTSQLFLQWQPFPSTLENTAPLIGWNIQLFLSKEDQLLVTITLQNPKIISRVFYNLSANTKYRAHVAGVNSEGLGPFRAKSSWTNSLPNGREVVTIVGPTEGRVSIESNVLLQCSTGIGNRFPVGWSREGNKQLPKAAQIFGEGRNLLLVNVAVEDGGRYVCSTGLSSSSFQIDVIRTLTYTIQTYILIGVGVAFLLLMVFLFILVGTIDYRLKHVKERRPEWAIMAPSQPIKIKFKKRKKSKKPIIGGITAYENEPIKITKYAC